MRIRLILFCVVAGLVSVSPLYGAVTVDFTRDVGAMKPLHGVNNSPNRLKGALPEFAVAGIPYARLHDTCGPFGGAHYVDVPNVFPDFDADENDPKSYDFAFTDAYLKPIVASGCKPFYRLGVTIENSAGLKAYNVYPPKDFAKWARICEHIIRHYNEGWANGFRWGIEYWEIWNEPESNTMWRGSTREAFFELYRTTALHLKAKFPGIKVGGYGSTGFLYADHEGIAEWTPDRERMTKRWLDWFEAFCDYVSAPETRAPVDFFSWHLYLREGSGTGPELIARHAELARRALDAHGMAKAESILDEWNWRPRHFWDEMKGNVGLRDAARAGGQGDVLRRLSAAQVLRPVLLAERTHHAVLRGVRGVQQAFRAGTERGDEIGRGRRACLRRHGRRETGAAAREQYRRAQDRASFHHAAKGRGRHVRGPDRA